VGLHGRDDEISADQIETLWGLKVVPDGVGASVGAFDV